MVLRFRARRPNISSSDWEGQRSQRYRFPDDSGVGRQSLADEWKAETNVIFLEPIALDRRQQRWRDASLEVSCWPKDPTIGYDITQIGNVGSSGMLWGMFQRHPGCTPYTHKQAADTRSFLRYWRNIQ